MSANVKLRETVHSKVCSWVDNQEKDASFRWPCGAAYLPRAGQSTCRCFSVSAYLGKYFCLSDYKQLTREFLLSTTLLLLLEDRRADFVSSWGTTVDVPKNIPICPLRFVDSRSISSKTETGAPSLVSAVHQQRTGYYPTGHFFPIIHPPIILSFLR